MRRVRLVLFIFIGLLLQACQPQKSKEVAQEDNHQPDYGKAASYNVQLGLGYLKQGDRPRAKKKLLTALKQEPNSPDVNAAMAYYLEQTKELPQAKKYYLKAISLSANSGAQLNNYGTFLCRQGDYQGAESYFLRAVKDPGYIHTSGAYENAGLCVLAIPDEKKAKSYFISALNQDPSRKESFYELVKLARKEGNTEEAYALLQKYPDLVLHDRTLLELAKQVANQEGRYEVAAAYENSLNKLGPSIDNSGVYNEHNSHNG